jgi:hypothetical protein
MSLTCFLLMPSCTFASLLFAGAGTPSLTGAGAAAVSASVLVLDVLDDCWVAHAFKKTANEPATIHTDCLRIRNLR